MDIEKFVSEALQSVMKGVKAAQEGGSEHMTLGTGPRNRLFSTLPGIMQDHNGGLYTTIDFDIAVTVTNSIDGSAHVSVVGIKLAGGGGSEHQTVSRIKFSVPAAFK